jgi:exoribonuclease R
MNRIAGTLELTSKVRYGLTARGAPIFRFIPYDKRFKPYAVGCSTRSLFYNVQAIVEPVMPLPTRPGELQRANLIENLGQASATTELEVLLTTYAQDSRKELRKLPELVGETMTLIPRRERLAGFTFHIDPPGCRDVDDSFTMKWDAEYDCWDVAINIADVAHYVPEGSTLDYSARQRATSFYTPDGQAIFPMLPQKLSEEIASLLPGSPKLTVSLCFEFFPLGKKIQNLAWKLTQTETNSSYTYDQADEEVEKVPELFALRQIAQALGQEAPDSHTMVQKLMILYNTEAGKLLAANKVGILRRHKEGKETVQIPGIPEFLTYEAAEYCLPTDDERCHFGLGAAEYAYASSPIRRYADLVNQRAIKKILEKFEPSPAPQTLVDELNRRQKQAKAFSRDLFFMTNLTNSTDHEPVEGIVIESQANKTKLWVPAWKRTITAKSLEPMNYARGTRCSIQWYADRAQARWKEKIVFRLGRVENAAEV